MASPASVPPAAATPQPANPQPTNPQAAHREVASPAELAPEAIQGGSGDGLSKSLALRLRFTKTDPAHESSFGPVAFERKSRSGLNLTGWTAINTVKTIWDKLEGSCSSIIDKERSYWEEYRSRRKKGEASSGSDIPNFVLRCYMVGPDRDHAGPCVAIVCKKYWFRKAIRDLITDCEVLGGRFRFIGLSAKIESPGDLSPDSHHDNHAHLSPVDLGRFGVVQKLANSRFQNGTAIEIVLQGRVVGRATLGGVVEVEGRRKGMTVSHVFQDREQTTDSDDDDDGSESDGVGIDLFDDDPVDLESTLYVDADIEAEYSHLSENHDRLSTSHGKASPGFLAGISNHPVRELAGAGTSQEGPSRDSVRRATGTSDPASWGVGDSFQGPKLDWTLHHLRPDAENKLFVEPSKDADPEAIVLKTPSQMLFGRNISTASLGMACLASSQPVTVVDLKNLVPGDCGSWAMSHRDGRFTGMLIGTCPSLGEAYLLPLTAIIEDLRQQSGLEMVIPLPVRAPVRASRNDNLRSRLHLDEQASSSRASLANGESGPPMPHMFSGIGWDDGYFHRIERPFWVESELRLGRLAAEMASFDAKFFGNDGRETKNTSEGDAGEDFG